MQRLASLLVLLLVIGCECGPGTQRTFGEAAWLPDEGVVVSGDDATLDFGWVHFGEDVSRVVRLSNRGRGVLTLQADGESDGGLTWLALDASLGPTDVAEWTVRFHPVDDGNPTGRRDFGATADVLAGGTANAQALRLHLRGQGYALHCGAIADLDFGTLLVGDTAGLDVSLSNPTPSDVVAELQPPVDGDGASFQWESSTLALPAGAMGQARLVFTPTEAREYVALARLRVSADCPLQAIRLHGRAVRSFLTWQPDDIDCGWVPVSAARAVSVEFRNTGPMPVDVRDFVTTGAAEGPAQPFTVPPDGAFTTQVACRPSALGAQAGTVRFTTSLDSTPEGVIALQMKGGGPRVSVTPVPLGFGRVAWAANGAPTSTRRLLIRNVGALPADAGSDGNLHLAADDGGVPALAFYETDGGVTAADVQLVSSAYRVDTGLRPRPEESLTVDVTFRPPSLGTLGFELGVLSDDLLAPEVRVPVSAHAEALPPCMLDVSPAALQFGLLYPDETRTLDVLLTNQRTQPGEDCLLSAIDVDSANAGAFELTGGRIESLVLHAGETRVLQVLARNLSPSGQKSGQLHLEVSSATQPSRTVPLTSFSSEACGVVMPAPVDFGPVPVGCTSTRPVTVYNLCAAPLTVQGATSSLADFAADAGITTLTTTESVTFDVRFSPQDAGLREGTLALGLGQSATQAVRLVDVSGTGVPLGQVTESFVQPAVPQLDVLITASARGAYETYDDGGVTDLYGPAAIAAGNAVAQMVDAGVDLHVGVAWAEWDRAVGEVKNVFPNNVPWETGELVPLPSGAKYVSTSTPAVGAMLAQVIESTRDLRSAAATQWDDIHFEVALRALTPPLATTLNAGFRRPGVQLAIVNLGFYGDYSLHYRPPVPPYPLSLLLPAPYYYGRLAQVAGGPSLLTVSSAVRLPGPPDCPGNAPAPDPGGRLSLMAQLSGGVVVDICEPTWADVFDTIRYSLVAFNRRFTLRGRPDTSYPMTVSIDGQVQPALSWQYDSSRNEVTFTVAPSPNAHVDISYFPNCT